MALDGALAGDLFPINIPFLRPVQLCGEERWRYRFTVMLCWGIKHGYGGLALPMWVAVFVDVNGRVA